MIYLVCILFLQKHPLSHGRLLLPHLPFNLSILIRTAGITAFICFLGIIELLQPDPSVVSIVCNGLKQGPLLEQCHVHTNEQSH